MTIADGVQIRTVTSDEDLAVLAEIVNTTTPEDPTTVDEMRWAERIYPGGRWLLAERGDRAVGAASVGRIYMYPPDYPDLWGSLVVRSTDRRKGIGEALLVAVSDHARSVGKTGLHMRATDSHPAGIEFLAHRGFAEIERSRMVRLELAGIPVPAESTPDGIVLDTLAARPDLVEGVYAVALETFADIPGGDEPMAVGDFEEFRARDVVRPGIPPEAFMLAIDPATDQVVGYASLIMIPGSETVAWHDMTAVRRAWRGRGIALALKRATIAWAIRRGLTALETGNDEANAPMRAVNARLGYQPLPDEVVMRGPLFAARGTNGSPRAS